MSYKQVILIRTDLKMSKGKTAAQASHAAVEASLKAKKKHRLIFSAWRLSGMKKVVIKVASQKDLYKYAQQAKEQGLTTAVIADAGMTELKPGTVTACAIGPDKDDKIDQVTGNLQTL
ncbi:peptidyl-tRNA hydrolase [Candidatus Woesearchaeota archaeon]|jgi:peptidyl-tRNA hydrolase, PTH2 family|nr:peptidyl-tRNA hydrolase [Candidatus Woesearchaeota archaeon]MBT4114555.1 peptidyl-tRNA hydrolase [Candidatus Woesearchaeota archaeon]MBT4248095.1 peptidyl-tRNA hydrolase [Candidatus Woesearchaeota archaeon]